MVSNRELRVLILEDNPDHAELIETALKAKDESFQVEICQRKSEFMKHLQQGRYDAFLIDYHLPDADGLEILEELTSLEYHTPVIFISGTENEEVITQVLHAGAADFIIKSRTSLKTLPIVVKRNIIRKMAFSEDGGTEKKSERNDSLVQNLEDALRKISATSVQFTQNLRQKGLPSMASDELHRLEDMLEKTSTLLKSAKEKIPLKFTSLKKKTAAKPKRAVKKSTPSL